ncbi:SEFIR domain-containing protein [Streptomyces chartreusis]|uniref:SEFIR domain-containing protein n=1 Tax=Streptomyces chartreusis TaxID=1969 RepID=UPI00365A8E5D
MGMPKEDEKVFVSWAHAHSSWNSEQVDEWARTVTRFVHLLVENGIDADFDRFHEGSRDIDWTRYGPTSVREANVVLLVVSSAYRERWEGVNKATEGAGAVREADTLLGIFNRDQREFQRKVLIVVLPGASPADVPPDLERIPRFTVRTLDDSGIEDLLRTLLDQPKYRKPKPGPRPVLDAHTRTQVQHFLEDATGKERETAPTAEKASSLQTREDELLTPFSRVRAVACTEMEGRPVAVVGGEGARLQIWDLASRTHLADLSGSTTTIRAVACTRRTGRSLAVTGDGNGEVAVWDLASRDQLASLGTPSGAVYAVACTEMEGRSVAVVGGEGARLQIWDLASNTHLADLHASTPAVRSVSCTRHDGQSLAVTGGDSDTLQVWDLANRTSRDLRMHTEGIHAAACARIKGRPVVIVANTGGRLRVYCVLTRTKITKIYAPPAPVRTLACMQLHGKEVAVTGDSDGLVRCWDLAEGIHLADLGSLDRAVWAVAPIVFRGHPTVIGGGDGRVIKVWSLTGLP